MPQALIIIVVIALFIVIPGVRIINQYERGIVLTLGKYSYTLNPGLKIIVPYLQRVIKVDIRTRTLDVPRQEVITKDNVTLQIDAVIYFKVLDPQKALLEIQNFQYATSTLAQTAMRDIAGNFELDELLSKLGEISVRLQQVVDQATDQWGVDVQNVKLQQIELPNDMKRAMAKQAESERERRAAIIAAEGEKASAQGVADAAAMLMATPGGMAIRQLQTLEKISLSPSQKTVVMVPQELMGILQKVGK